MTIYKHEALAVGINWDDEAQHAEFMVQLEDCDDSAIAAKLLSVVNKPSQFVGRVCDLPTAIAHWQAWDKWNAENEQALEPIVGPAKRGRPASKNREAIENASDEWHKAVNGRKQAKLDWTAWRKAEVAKIDMIYSARILEWDIFVASKREELSRLQNAV